MKTNPILETNVWVIDKEADENLKTPQENVWREVTVDMTEVCAIECNGPSFDEDFVVENAAVIHLRTGRSFTLDRPFSEINELFIKVKKEIYACS